MANNMETINNKYKVWHDNIIARGKNRVLTCYTEKHHIIPKCLGGSNNEDNLVRLTAKEHFIVHMLLCKFTEGRNRHLVLVAFEGMCRLKNDRRNYKITSRVSAKLREESKQHSHMKTDKYKQMFSKRMMGNTITLGFKHKSETKNKIAERLKGNQNTKGMVFINKNGKSRAVKPELVNDYLKEGFKLGKDRSYITAEYRELHRRLTTARNKKVA
jgi:hypothetical protein